MNIAHAFALVALFIATLSLNNTERFHAWLVIAHVYIAAALVINVIT